MNTFKVDGSTMRTHLSEFLGMMFDNVSAHAL